ncbi:MAG TPA: hypothetical protein VMW40_07355 [Candidatus Bathyarchaeia archaeon]|nr:hypothetical protein [Candidatus Bathyarchaeia archaeon]
MDNAEKQISDELIGFKEEIESIQKAINDFESGRKSDIAIIAEPFAGRTTLVNAIEKMTARKVTKLLFSSLIKNKDAVRLPEQPKGIVIVDHCHFLFTRAIGGFGILDEFLKSVLSSDNLFITTWNLYAWNYLDEVINVGQFFPVQLKLPKFTTQETKELILSRYKEDEIQFVDDVKSENQTFITFSRVPVTVKPLGKTVNIPSIAFNYNLLRFRLSRKKEVKTPQDIIFELLNYYSNGNPGVAEKIWEKSLEYPKIKPSYVKECSFKIELDYTESFILYCILSMESVTKEELAAMSGDSKVEEVLSRLVQQDLITVDNGYYSVNPEALKCVVGHLKKAGVIW